MDDRRALARLHRTAGFGVTADELAAAVARGPEAELDRLLTVPATLDDPWDDDRVTLDPRDRAARIHAIDAWANLLATTSTPLVDRMAWLWHGHFVSSFDKVRPARAMVEQVRLFRRAGLGPMGALLRAVTVDGAMLLYLDGTTSTAGAPNENYARELLELFTLGVGNYTEADVRAGARALTGWRYRRLDGTVAFVRGRHDDTPQRYLGADGVHDVDTVAAAVTAHPAFAPFVTRVVAGELLGTVAEEQIAAWAAAFRTADHDIGVLVRLVLEAGLADQGTARLLGPVPWLAIAQRVTGAVLPVRTRLLLLRAAGQLPMVPPNVAGWPGGRAWGATSTMVGRANLAAEVAAATPADSPVLAAAAGRPDDLAVALALPEPVFTSATAAALASVGEPRRRLALALLSPEFTIS